MALDESNAGGRDQGFYEFVDELAKAVNRGTFVRHGADSTKPRPTPGDSTPLGVVAWVGTVAPDNHLAEADRDFWLDATSNVWKRWDGTAWVVVGTAFSQVDTSGQGADRLLATDTQGGPSSVPKDTYQRVLTVDARTFGTLTDDGTTDNSATIQAAIDSIDAATAALGGNGLDAGGVVELPEGDYACNITLKRGVLVRGQGYGYGDSTAGGGTTLRAFAAGTPVVTTPDHNIAGSGLERLRIVGDAADTAQDGLHLQDGDHTITGIAGSTNMGFRDLWVTQCGRYGVFIEGKGLSGATDQAWHQFSVWDNVIVTECGSVGFYGTGAVIDNLFSRIEVRESGSHNIHFDTYVDGANTYTAVNNTWTTLTSNSAGDSANVVAHGFYDTGRLTTIIGGNFESNGAADTSGASAGYRAESRRNNEGGCAIKGVEITGSPIGVDLVDGTGHVVERCRITYTAGSPPASVTAAIRVAAAAEPAHILYPQISQYATEVSWLGTQENNTLLAANSQLAGQVRAASGSLAAPGLSFAAAQGHGFRYVSGLIQAIVGGTEVFRFNPSSVRAAFPLQLPDGTAAQPALANTGDTDTGLYFPTDNKIAGVVAGNQALRLEEPPAQEDTALLIRVNDAGTPSLKQVSMGADDSAGAGFRQLRVPN